MSTKVFTGNIRRCTEYKNITTFESSDISCGRIITDSELVKEGALVYKIEPGIYLVLETEEELSGEKGCPGYKGQVYVDEDSLVPYEKHRVKVIEVEGAYFVVTSPNSVIELPKNNFNLYTIKRLMIATQGGVKNKILDILDKAFDYAYEKLTSESTKHRLADIAEKQRTRSL